MAVIGWRLLYSGLVTGDILGELPFVSLSHTDSYLSTGTWSAVVPFDAPDTIRIPDGLGGESTIDRSDVVDYSELSPGQIVVYIERSGVIVGSGILWAVQVDYLAGTMTLSGAGIGSFFAKRLLPTLSFVATDQTEIAHDIITNVNGYPSIGVNVPVVSTGRLRDRSYLFAEAKPALEALDQLANVYDGFDYRFRCRWESGAIARNLYFDYPATGRITDLVFEVGVNAAILNYSEDGSTLANRVRAIGAGEGVDKLWRVKSTTPSGELPILETSISHVDVSDAATLDEHASRRLQRSRQAMRRVSLTKVPDALPALGSFDVGDRVFVKIRRGWLNVADFFRIVELSIAVDANGETISIALAGQEAFDA